MNQTIEWKKTQSGSTEAVRFSDGMLVTAEDLTAAMRYPLSVVQVLLKAFFGCGIVCGLDLKNPAEGQAAKTPKVERDLKTSERKKAPPKVPPNFILTVEKGVALGCDGYPIEICGPLKLDLTPDPCRSPPETAEKMFVAARRVTAAEAAARPCGCGSTGGEPAQQCTRMRDHALVQAFDERDLPTELRWVLESPAKENADQAAAISISAERLTGAAAVCACLKQCGECACCGEPWVLLGSVMVSEDGGLGTIDGKGRRYVKPLACVCDAVERDQDPPATRAAPKADESKATEEPAGKAAAK